MKYLATKQISKQGSAVALQLKAENWVSNIWKQGFYPFKPPFVYDQGSKKIISFPPFFQVLSAPLLRLCGYSGLYVIPALSLVLMWIWFGWILYRLRIRVPVIAAALFSLAFCTPLTLYGAVYWEHTLAVLLLFGGIVFLIKPGSTTFQGIMLGCLTGLAAWLRPEALLLWILIVSAIIYNQYRQPKKVNNYFIASSLAVVACFFLCNKMLYGDYLGAHSYQFNEPLSFVERLILLLHLNAKQALYFPLMLVVYAMVIYQFSIKYFVSKTVIQLLLIALLFSLIAPFFLPNGGGKQGGPRYFLFLVPTVLIAGALLADSMSWNAVARKSGWLIGLTVLYSLYLNSFRAYTSLHNDYAYRVKPCVQLLRQDTCTIVVVQNQFIAQEFAALFETKSIFLAENRQQYATLQHLLQAGGKREWVFVARDKDLLLPCSPHEQNAASVRHAGDYFLVKCTRTK